MTSDEMHQLLNISHKRDKNMNSIAKMQIIELHFDILECFFMDVILDVDLHH